MNLIDELKDKVLLHLSRLTTRRVVTGFDEFCLQKSSRKALVSYLVLPLLPPPSWRDRIKFSNRGIAQLIPRALNELGYRVDIVNYDNQSWVPSQPYDLFVGHGGINFERLSRSLPEYAYRIYFSTGIYWRESNARLADRIHALNARRGYCLPPHKAVLFDEDYANQVADGIVCLGNRAAVQTYSKFSHVIGLNNAVFPVQWNGWQNKNYTEGRRHFLFFSGRGSVLKGLDLLLEAFSKSDGLHLHICHHMDPDFIDVYRRELSQCPNIHVHGLLKMRSSQFHAVASGSNWIISTTCTEGQPGAVLECMGHGLIPILPPSANIDLEDWGILLPDCNIDTIRSILTHASEMEADECRRRAIRVVEATHRTYSADLFRMSFKKAVTEILNAAHKRRHVNYGLASKRSSLPNESDGHKVTLRDPHSF